MVNLNEVDENEIVVTPGMIGAGADVFCCFFDSVLAHGSEFAKFAAMKVFLEMVSRSRCGL